MKHATLFRDYVRAQNPPRRRAKVGTIFIPCDLDEPRSPWALRLQGFLAGVIVAAALAFVVMGVWSR